MKRLDILVITRPDLIPPDTLDGLDPKAIELVKADFDIVHGLRELGHRVRAIGIEHELAPLAQSIEQARPDIVFNLIEEFDASLIKLAYVLGYLDLVRVPYTGCNATGMLFSSNKALQRKILRHHRIRTPEFAIFRIGRAVRRPTRLRFPLIVKSATAHGSAGIARASVVDSDDKLAERVEFVQRTLGTDAIAEEYIDGREFYVGLIGNRRIDAFPPWELSFKNLPPGAPKIATERAKWDPDHQERVGFATGRAEGLDAEAEARMIRLCRRAYRALQQTGYARMDLRMNDEGRIYLIESNPNPQLAEDEDFALSAQAAGVRYPALLSRVLSLGLRQSASSDRSA